MRLFTRIFFTAMLTLMAFSVITYTACKQDKCKDVACVNGGACQDGACICSSGFTGTHCETTIIPVDPCANVVCQNGGTCHNGACSCPTGFEGTYCETIIRDKFIGTWQGTDYCTAPADTIGVTMTLGNGPTDVQVVVNNPGGFGSTIVINGTATSSTVITFTNQTIATGVTLNGTMTLHNATSLTFHYTVSDPTGTQTCDGDYTKQ